MAYSEAAKEIRRCRGTKKDGEPCRAYAVWDDPRGLCAAHLRPHTGPMKYEYAPGKRAAYPPCTCRAYDWPHRPGGGLCQWPDLPERRLTTLAGTHSVFNGIRHRMCSLGMRLNQQRYEAEARKYVERY